MSRRSTFRVLALAALVIALAVFIPGCGDDDKDPVGPGGGGSGADVTIDILSMTGPNFYSPLTQTVTVGQTVRWRNTDATTHTATADGGAFNTGNVAGGATSAAITMNTAGTFPYHCTIHSNMQATLIVNP